VALGVERFERYIMALEDASLRDGDGFPVERGWVCLGHRDRLSAQWRMERDSTARISHGRRGDSEFQAWLGFEGREALSTADLEIGTTVVEGT
jgi:hypothetical protein